MNLADFLTSSETAFRHALGSAGFRESNAGTWIRQTGDELNVVSIQMHSSEPLFCVNLGVHYSFLPKAGTEAPLNGPEIDHPDCEIKLRLTSDPAAKDQWWPLTNSSISEIEKLLSSRGLAIFDDYRLSGLISSMDAKSIESGNPGLLSGLTKVRACLLLSRMHEKLGSRDKCIDAANLGIKLAGMAVGPKKALKDILKRCG